MKKPFLVWLALFSSLWLLAQPKYFIAIDADDAKPFSVKIGKKIYPSDPYGHLVMASLKDTTHQLVISFPGNRYPVQRFEVVLGRQDRGFSLKRVDEKNYVLLDWQGGAPVVNRTYSPSRIPDLPAAGGTPNAFARLMAAVVNDPAFIVDIPDTRDAVASVERKALPAAIPATVTKMDSPAVKLSRAAGVINPDTVNRKAIAGTVRCRQTAVTAEVDKLRIELLGAGSVEKQLDLSHKFFEQRCVHTAQVRALSELYFTDEHRYQFFALAYPYVTDPSLYRTLERFFSDQQVILRFRTMLK